MKTNRVITGNKGVLENTAAIPELSHWQVIAGCKGEEGEEKDLRSQTRPSALRYYDCGTG